MKSYFQNFPTISYGNNLVTNITARVVLSKLVQKNSSAIRPYVVAEGERPDMIAGDYYGDPKYAWVVYLTNLTFDPYFDWPLNDEQFNDLLIKKYGSIEDSMLKPYFFRTNFTDDIITTSAYEALSSVLKKYWRPILSADNIITGYERSDINLTAETSKVVSIAVSNSSPFQVGSIITQYNVSNDKIATGIVELKSNNNITIKHVLGTFNITAGNNGPVYTQSNTLSANVSQSTTIHTAITNTEIAYWEPVTFHDYEVEVNNSKRFIKLLDNSLIGQLETEIEDLL